MNAVSSPQPRVPSRQATAAPHAIERRPLDPHLLAGAKCAFSTRRVDFGRAQQLIAAGLAPQAGQLVLARVRRIRQHTRIELASGRRAHLYPDDLVVLAYGNRYATDQFEARVPDTLGPCHMVAAGGIASRMLSRNAAIKPATEIEPLGILADAQGRPLDLRQFALADGGAAFDRAPCIALLGSSMNAGKTTAAADLIYGLTRAGLRVAAAKVTGTGSGGDLWMMGDAGARRVIDFTDAGHPSTDQLDPPALGRILRCLGAELQRGQPDITLFEVADGIYQRETAQLLAGGDLAPAVDGLLYASGDMVGAVSGARHLLERGFAVLGIAGKVTQSALAVREVEAACELPVYARHHLQEPSVAQRLYQFVRTQQRRAPLQAAG